MSDVPTYTSMTYEEEMAGLREIAANYAKYGAENVLDPNELGYGYIPDIDDEGNLIPDPDDDDFDPDMWSGDEVMEPVDPADSEVDYFDGLEDGDSTPSGSQS